jgi:hypothetical protein
LYKVKDLSKMSVCFKKRKKNVISMLNITPSRRA